MDDRPIKDYSATRFTPDDRAQLTDRVVVEQPIDISLDGTDIVTILCTPTDLDAMAVGYLAGERYIVDIDDVQRIDVADDGSAVAVTTVSKSSGSRVRLPSHGLRVRSLSPGGGGSRVSSHMFDAVPAGRIGEGTVVGATDIRVWMKKFTARSALFRETGGVHSAAIHLADRVVAFSEDIGRHTAVDKVFGRAMLESVHLDRTVLLTSGRISAEMVVKCALREVSIVVSRGAVTNLAIDLAGRMGVTVVGFARGPRMTAYTHARRITDQDIE